MWARLITREHDTEMKRHKYILTSAGAVRLGYVALHRELIEPGDYCIGGGLYEIDYAERQLVFYGESMDYGAPRWIRAREVVLPRDYEGFPPVLLTSSDKVTPLADVVAVRYE